VSPRIRSRCVVCIAALIACSDHAASEAALPDQSPLERAIAHDVDARLGAASYVHCVEILGVPLSCSALLPDRSELPIALHDAGSAWEWSIDGRLVAAAPIEAYVRDVVRDLGAAQSVTCGAALRRLPAGERVACHLERGGTAFVSVAADGTLGVEVQLDPAAAAARGEPVTHAKDAELDGLSRALAQGSDGE
jgi:hypothetical protein